jgi:peptidoglycan/xylan/chitin deacetylase (PgdA/CDA1 family)
MSWTGLSRKIVRSVQSLVPSANSGVTILSYHLVGGETSAPVDLPTDTFHAQIRELLDLAHVCSLADALIHLETGGRTMRPVVVITFDDAFDNFRSKAWPLLAALRVPVTLYVPVGFVEGTAGSPLKRADHLKAIEWNALRALASDPLLTVGSHSWCHGDLRRLTTDHLRDDLRGSRDRLQDVLGRRIEHFCYPQAKWSRTVEREVRTFYRTAVVAGGRKNFPNRFRPERLFRTPVRRDMPVRLAPLVHSRVWLEEWAASHARALA